MVITILGRVRIGGSLDQNRCGKGRIRKFSGKRKDHGPNARVKMKNLREDRKLKREDQVNSEK
jgi:hypothetical protein